LILLTSKNSLFWQNFTTKQILTENLWQDI